MYKSPLGTDGQALSEALSAALSGLARVALLAAAMLLPGRVVAQDDPWLDGLAQAPSGQGSDKPVIQWVAMDLQPFFSFTAGQAALRSGDLGPGGSGGFLRLLIERMPQYRHEFVEVSTRRYEALSRSGQTLCSVLHLSSPARREWAFFTPLHPALEASQLHLIVRREDAARWGLSPDQPARLSSLLKRPDLRPLIARDRSYGPDLDKLLGSDPKLQTLSWAIRVQQPLSMLAAHRGDFTLEYPVLLAQQQNLSSSTKALVAIPIAELQDSGGMTISASCSRTPEGRRRIDDLDAVIRLLARDPPESRTRWLNECYGQALPSVDMQRFNRFFDERSRQGSLVE